jgi:hypothetical protein
MTRQRLQIGDVFTLPVDDERVGFGQIVARWEEADGYYYFAIFERLYRRSEQPPLDVILKDRIAFLALSLDALLFVGDWTVVGRVPVATDIPLPAYKEAVGTPDRVCVVDYSGRRCRRSTAEEAERLSYRTVVAPVRLEKALQAKHGLQPWQAAYSELEPQEEMTTAKLFGKHIDA